LTDLERAFSGRDVFFAESSLSYYKKIHPTHENRMDAVTTAVSVWCYKGGGYDVKAG